MDLHAPTIAAVIIRSHDDLDSAARYAARVAMDYASGPSHIAYKDAEKIILEKRAQQRRWQIQDFGEASVDNGVWLYCKNLAARDLMEIGNTCYLDFQTGAGKDTLKVERIN